MRLLSIFLFLALLSTSSFAEQKLNINIPGGGAQDLLNMTTIPDTISDHSRDYSIIRSCTNIEGRVIYQGDPAYGRCIRAAERMKRTGRPPRVAAPAPNDSHIITIQSPNQSN